MNDDQESKRASTVHNAINPNQSVSNVFDEEKKEELSYDRIFKEYDNSRKKEKSNSLTKKRRRRHQDLSDNNSKQNFDILTSRKGGKIEWNKSVSKEEEKQGRI